MQWLVPVVLAFMALAPMESEAVRFRCGVFSFFGNDRACRLSCWVTGHKTGNCDEDDNCNCSETELDLSESIDRLLDGLDVFEYVELKWNTFVAEVKSWELPDAIKSLAPSRCKIGNAFCNSSCHAIGRLDGTCNEDFSDCACNSEFVSPRQYSLCLDDGVCSLVCQRDGKARGACEGPYGWDCRCYSNKEATEEDAIEFSEPSLNEIDVENVEFNA
ncbi:uncharacterized protein LOC131893483 [Tigriopus californicus]|nr:uncharacterized protein LOC131893483 [Tigriopus californicus]|eukprot:TCALIF_07022-PA protein Name:"Protein of unknown function" AED:0.00 eAED:0.00 QI:87/1/1/1/1/1/4/144/216